MRSPVFTSTDTGFDYKPTIGSSISECIDTCIAKAKLADKPVTIRSFNDIDVLITPTTTVKDALVAWQADMDRRYNAYKNSAKGKQAKIDAETRRQYAQRNVDQLLADLAAQTVVTTDYLVKWLAAFSEHADHISVTYDRQALLNKLEGLGYVENAHVTKDKSIVASWSRQTMGEYIIGQAINCMQNGMAPHPGMTQRFAKDYANMPAAKDPQDVLKRKVKI